MPYFLPLTLPLIGKKKKAIRIYMLGFKIHHIIQQQNKAAFTKRFIIFILIHSLLMQDQILGTEIKP